MRTSKIQRIELDSTDNVVIHFDGNVIELKRNTNWSMSVITKTTAMVYLNGVNGDPRRVTSKVHDADEAYTDVKEMIVTF